jgi:hypothetical protein
MAEEDRVEIERQTLPAARQGDHEIRLALLQHLLVADRVRGATVMIVPCGTIQISVASSQIRRYVVKRSAVRGGNVASR